MGKTPGFCDKLFSSPHLFRGELYEYGLYVYGTGRQTRPDFPTDLRHLSLVQRVGQHGSLTLVMWQDKRPCMFSRTVTAGKTKTVSRRQRNGSVAEVSCPSAILTYTKYMGGVDLGDQRYK